MLEEVIIRTLAVWGILGVRIENLTGVWVGEKKIAAMGVRIEKGVTMHGFSLNVNVDLEPFAKIIPCGIEGCRVTSMAALLGCHIDIVAVRTCIAATFAEVFGIRWTNVQGTELQDLPPTALAVERV
jgi:lipoate-protein ligase B